MAGNLFFRFKEFTVRQDRCAMKVCTDACTFGAIVDIHSAGRILDIGAGTGLLSLMAAQRNSGAFIDSVEIDKDAFEQAAENVEASPYADRIQVFQTAIQEFQPGIQYDVIITNPPFFQSDLRSPSGKKNVAHHAETLSFDQLLHDAARLLKPDGSFYVLLPVDEAMIFQGKAEKKGWYLEREVLLKHNPVKKPFRSIMTLKIGHFADIQLDRSCIEVYGDNAKAYTPEFKKLLSPFYLIF